MPMALDLHGKTQVAARPDEVLMAAESQWLFTEDELLHAPSILDGLAPEKERENRAKGVNFIIQINPNYHYYSIAATSIFLATKVEENCRKMKDLVIACVRIAQKNPSKVVDEQDKEYWKWRDNILLNEDVLLEALCFDLRLDAPYKNLYDMMTYLKQEDNKILRNTAWAFINDSCYTTLSLLFSTRVIGASALYAAARHTQTALPDHVAGKPWWDSLGVELSDISRACHYMSQAYQSIPVKGARDLTFYSQSATDVRAGIEATRTSGNSTSDLQLSSVNSTDEMDGGRLPG